MRNIEEFIDQQVLKDSKEYSFINSLIKEVLEEPTRAETTKAAQEPAHAETAKLPEEPAHAETANRGNASEYTTYIKLIEKFSEYCSSKNIKLTVLDFNTGSPIEGPQTSALQTSINQAQEKIDFYIGQLKKEEPKEPHWSYDPKIKKDRGYEKAEKEREENYEYIKNKLFTESELAVNNLFKSTFFKKEYLLVDKKISEIIIKPTGKELSGKSTADLEIKLIVPKDSSEEQRIFRISLKRGNPQAYASSRYISRDAYEASAELKLPVANGTVSGIDADRSKVLKSLGGGPIKLLNLFGFEDLNKEKEIEVQQQALAQIYIKYTTPPFLKVSPQDVSLYNDIFNKRFVLINEMFENFSKKLETELQDPKKCINVINVFYNLLTRADEDVKAYIDLKEGPSILFTPLMEMYAGHIQKIEVEKTKTKNPRIIFKIGSEASIAKFIGKKSEKEKLLDSGVYERLEKIIKLSQEKLKEYRNVDEDKYNRLYELFLELGISGLDTDSVTDQSLKGLYNNVLQTSDRILKNLADKKIFEIEFSSPKYDLETIITKKRLGQDNSGRFYLEFEKQRNSRKAAIEAGNPPPSYSDFIINLFKPSDYERKKPQTKEKFNLKLDTITDYNSFKRSYFARGAEKRYSSAWNMMSDEEQRKFEGGEEEFKQLTKEKEEEEARKERASREGQTKFLVQQDFKKFISILNQIYEFEKTDRSLQQIFRELKKILLPTQSKKTEDLKENISYLINNLILEQLNEKEYSKVMKKVSSSGAKGLISAVPSNKTANTIAVRFDADESIDSGIKKIKSSLRSSGYELEDKRVLKFDQNRDTTDVIKNGEVVARLFFRTDIKERKGLAYEHIIGAVLTKKITTQLKNRIDLPPDASKEEVMRKLKSEEFGKLFNSAKKAAPIIRQKVGNVVSAESVGSTNNKADFVLKTDQGKTVGLSAKYAAGEKDNEYKMNKVLGFGTEDDSLVKNPKGTPWWIVGRKTFLNKLKSQTSSYGGREYNPDPEDLDAPAWMKTAKESNPEIYKETMEEVYGAIRDILAANLKKLGLKGLIAFVNEADLGKEEERENYDIFLKVMDGPSGLSVTEISLDGVQSDGFDANVNLDQIVVQDRSDIIIKIPGHDELKINSVKFKSDMLSSKAGDLKIKTR